MKKQIVFLATFLAIGLLLFSPACNPEDECEPCYCSEEGKILGLDPRECACCGGWFIEIGNDTLRAWTLPETFTEDLELNNFPLPVLLEWEYMENPCLGDEIEVACIRRR